MTRFDDSLFEAADEEGHQQHKRILLVDDEKHVTAALKSGLECRGFAVDAFNSPQDAIVQFRKMVVNNHKYELIILDVRMPQMNGFYLARELWQMDREAKFCFLTAHAAYENEAANVLPDLQGYCFIQKPVSITELARIIKQQLAANRLQRGRIQ